MEPEHAVVPVVQIGAVALEAFQAIAPSRW